MSSACTHGHPPCKPYSTETRRLRSEAQGPVSPYRSEDFAARPVAFASVTGHLDLPENNARILTRHWHRTLLAKNERFVFSIVGHWRFTDLADARLALLCVCASFCEPLIGSSASHIQYGSGDSTVGKKCIRQRLPGIEKAGCPQVTRAIVLLAPACQLICGFSPLCSTRTEIGRIDNHLSKWTPASTADGHWAVSALARIGTPDILSARITRRIDKRATWLLERQGPSFDIASRARSHHLGQADPLSSARWTRTKVNDAGANQEPTRMEPLSIEPALRIRSPGTRLSRKRVPQRPRPANTGFGENWRPQTRRSASRLGALRSGTHCDRRRHADEAIYTTRIGKTALCARTLTPPQDAHRSPAARRPQGPLHGPSNLNNPSFLGITAVAQVT